MSVNPIRCVTLARWLTRGMFNSVGWLPFLNCASALPVRSPNPAIPTNNLRTDFDMLRITAPSSLLQLRPGGAPSPGATPPLAVDAAVPVRYAEIAGLGTANRGNSEKI